MECSGSNPFLFRSGPLRTKPPGYLLNADAVSFPVVAGNAGSASFLVLEPKGIRAPHWHMDVWELDYCISGKGRAAVVAPGDVWNTFEIVPGDIVFVPQGYFHYFENNGDEVLTMLLVFNADEVKSIGLGPAVGGLPRDILAASFGVCESAVKEFPVFHKQSQIIERLSTSGEKSN